MALARGQHLHSLLVLVHCLVSTANLMRTRKWVSGELYLSFHGNSNCCLFCSDLHIRSNISCPVSPCGSPLLRSRSPQNTNGRMSPSPISSPRTLSGASTPLSGGNGAIPFNHLRQPTYNNEGFAIASRGPDDHFPNRPTDRNLGQFVRVHQVSQGLQERVVSDADRKSVV